MLLFIVLLAEDLFSIINQTISYLFMKSTQGLICINFIICLIRGCGVEFHLFNLQPYCYNVLI